MVDRSQQDSRCPSINQANYNDYTFNGRQAGDPLQKRLEQVVTSFEEAEQLQSEGIEGQINQHDQHHEVGASSQPELTAGHAYSHNMPDEVVFKVDPSSTAMMNEHVASNHESELARNFPSLHNG